MLYFEVIIYNTIQLKIDVIYIGTSNTYKITVAKIIIKTTRAVIEVAAHYVKKQNQMRPLSWEKIMINTFVDTVSVSNPLLSGFYISASHAFFQRLSHSDCLSAGGVRLESRFRRIWTTDGTGTRCSTDCTCTDIRDSTPVPGLGCAVCTSPGRDRITRFRSQLCKTNPPCIGLMSSRIVLRIQHACTQRSEKKDHFKSMYRSVIKKLLVSFWYIPTIT